MNEISIVLWLMLFNVATSRVQQQPPGAEWCNINPGGERGCGYRWHTHAQTITHTHTYAHTYIYPHTHTTCTHTHTPTFNHIHKQKHFSYLCLFKQSILSVDEQVIFISSKGSNKSNISKGRKYWRLLTISIQIH